VTRHRQALPPGMDDAIALQLSEEAADAIDQLLLNLRIEINARGVLVIEGNGSVVAAKGAIKDLNISALGALIAGNYAAFLLVSVGRLCLPDKLHYPVIGSATATSRDRRRPSRRTWPAIVDRRAAACLGA
jgi:hypothetical protein